MEATTTLRAGWLLRLHRLRRRSCPHLLGRGALRRWTHARRRLLGDRRRGSLVAGCDHYVSVSVREDGHHELGGTRRRSSKLFVTRRAVHDPPVTTVPAAPRGLSPVDVPTVRRSIHQRDRAGSGSPTPNRSGNRERRPIGSRPHGAVETHGVAAAGHLASNHVSQGVGGAPPPLSLPPPPPPPPPPPLLPLSAPLPPPPPPSPPPLPPSPPFSSPPPSLAANLHGVAGANPLSPPPPPFPSPPLPPSPPPSPPFPLFSPATVRGATTAS